MAGKQIASLYADIGAKTDNFAKGAASVKSGLGEISAVLGIAGVALGAFQKAWDMSQQAAQLERLAVAGHEIARQFGGDMDLIVSKVKDASMGTVSEMDIISASNRAMMLGLSADADKLANLMKVAAFRGRAMGVDTTKAFNDIVTGIGRSSPLILDNLGIVINAKETYSKYAESIGKSERELMKAEKTQALMNAVLDEGNKMLGEAGGLAKDNAAMYERWNAELANTQQYLNEMPMGLSRLADMGADALISIRELADNGLGYGGEKLNLFSLLMELGAKRVANMKAEQYAARDAALAHGEALNAAASGADEAARAYIELTTADQELTKANQDYLDLVGDLFSSDERLIREQDEVNQKYTEGKITLDERNIALDELAAKQEEASQRMILSMLQEQLAAEGLSTEEMQYLLTVGQQWGIYSQSAVDAANAAIAKAAELAGAFNGLPTEKTIGINIITTGGMDLYRGVATSETTHRFASGGSFIIPPSYGNEGFRMGNNATASAGEMVTVTPRGQQGGGLSDAAIIAAAIPTARDNAKALARELMKLGMGNTR